MNSELLSPYDFWQFWRNTDDNDVAKFLLLYTELPYEDCVRYGSFKGQEINHAKILLADKVTNLCHGEKAASAAKKTATNVFEGGILDPNLPTKVIYLDDLNPEITIIQLLVKSELVTSGKEAKRLISDQGAKYNGKLITSSNLKLSKNDFEVPLKLSAGKKRHVLIKLQHNNL